MAKGKCGICECIKKFSMFGYKFRVGEQYLYDYKDNSYSVFYGKEKNVLFMDTISFNVYFKIETEEYY